MVGLSPPDDCFRTEVAGVVIMVVFGGGVGVGMGVFTLCTDVTEVKPGGNCCD